MLVGQAVLESGWGMSRFAKEANNLFGIRVFKSTAPHLLPLEKNGKVGVLESLKLNVIQ